MDAGGAFEFGSAPTGLLRDDQGLAIQGSGLPPLPVPPRYFNTDYTFIDDNNPEDVTRAMVGARRRFKNESEMDANIQILAIAADVRGCYVRFARHALRNER